MNFIIVLLLVGVVQADPACVKEISRLAEIFVANRTQFNQQIAPYALLSGKNIDDLGYPDYCNRNPDYLYTTVSAKVLTAEKSQYQVYLGFCFSRKCSTSELNTYAQFIADYILEDYEVEGQVKFIQPVLNLQFSWTTFLTCMMFFVFLMASMMAPIKKWIQLCKQTEDEEYIIKSTYIDLEKPNKSLEEDEDEEFNEGTTFWERISLVYRWKQLWKPEETTKIKSFTIFRFISVPILIYGECFYLSNQAAFNYLSFNEEIYSSFYAKLAMFSYYLPDIFLFISGFLFASKVFQHQNLMQAIVDKTVRLYPLYWAALLIYWLISPGLHAGPVWFVYQNEVAVCNGSWWKVFLMIDNWFSQSCYPLLWFVQVQVQLTLFSSTFFLLHSYNKKASFWYLGFLILVSWVLLFVLSGQLITTVDVAINEYTQLYFRSFYSHMGFYFVGIMMALLSVNNQIKEKLKIIFKRPVAFIIMNVIFIFLLIFIIVRPSIWQTLGIELGLCRTGILICFMVFFTPQIFFRNKHSTNIHKFGNYVYPIILISYLVAGSSFWAAGSFPYVSGLTLVNSVIPVCLISVSVGIFIGLLFDFRSLINK